MSETIDLKLHVWRQNGPSDAGKFEDYSSYAREISTHASFLEFLDVVNERLVIDERLDRRGLRESAYPELARAVDAHAVHRSHTVDRRDVHGKVAITGRVVVHHRSDGVLIVRIRALGVVRERGIWWRVINHDGAVDHDSFAITSKVGNFERQRVDPVSNLRCIPGAAPAEDASAHAEHTSCWAGVLHGHECHVGCCVGARAGDGVCGRPELKSHCGRLARSGGLRRRSYSTGPC